MQQLVLYTAVGLVVTSVLALILGIMFVDVSLSLRTKIYCYVFSEALFDMAACILDFDYWMIWLLVDQTLADTAIFV